MLFRLEMELTSKFYMIFLFYFVILIVFYIVDKLYKIKKVDSFTIYFLISFNYFISLAHILYNNIVDIFIFFALNTIYFNMLKILCDKIDSHQK